MRKTRYAGLCTRPRYGTVFDSSSPDASPVESEMRRGVLLLGLLFYGLIVMAGCSSSSPSEPAKIDGMSPAEYREKAEPSQKAQPKTKKTG
jgi:hypothetical protein